jgi:acyl CoA:acetate/3-ketoacid CoA transferase beta subunit
MIVAMIIFGENNFIFSFVGYGLVTKSLAAGCTFEKVAEKTKCEYFYNQIRMNHPT